MIAENEGELEADRLQQLHILHNLAELVATKTLKSHTLRDDQYAGKAAELRYILILKINKIFTKNLFYINNLQLCRNQLIAFRENQATEASFQFKEVGSKIVMDPSFYRSGSSKSQPWWLEAANFLDQNKLFKYFYFIFVCFAIPNIYFF